MKIHFSIVFIACTVIFSCKEKTNNHEISTVRDTTKTSKPFFKLSLAEWSLNKPMFAGTMSPFDFAQEAHELGFEGLEYVSQIYTKELEKYEDPKVGMDSLVANLDRKSKKFDMKNVLIMVDNEGDLSSGNINERDEAVENHKKWVDAAAVLGCHAIRVNLFGATEREVWKAGSIDGLKKLSAYAKTKGLEVLVENHGGFSSDAQLLVEVMDEVAMNNCGTLPDFGNFCLERKDGARWDSTCIKEYPRYEGIEELMTKAKAVSAKTYAFDDRGQETIMDYTKILQIVKDAGYTGYIGVEYEGDLADPKEGIRLTKELLLSSAEKLK